MSLLSVLTRQYSIASAYGTSIFYGDAVKLVTGGGGTVERDTFDAAMTPIRCLFRLYFTDPSTEQVTFKQYFPASTAASDIKAYVADGTDILLRLRLYLRAKRLAILPLLILVLM